MNKNLSKAMFGNLIFSGFCAISFLLFAQFLATGTGIPEAAFYIIGIGLLGFASLLGYGISNKKLRPQIAKIVVLLDWLWVASSFVTIVSGLVSFKPIGLLGVLSIAVIVAGFAIWQQQEA